MSEVNLPQHFIPEGDSSPPSQVLGINKQFITSLREFEREERVLCEGVPTVYAPRLWEEEVYNRTGYTYPGYSYKYKSPLLNPVIAGDPGAMELVSEGNIVAVNPAMVSNEYLSLLKRVVQESYQVDGEDEAVRKRLIEEVGVFSEVVNSRIIGRRLVVEFPDGKRTKVIVMGVSNPTHSAEMIGLIPAKEAHALGFVGDFRNEFIQRNTGFSYNYKERRWEDSDTGKQAPSFEVKLIN